LAQAGGLAFLVEVSGAAPVSELQAARLLEAYPRLREHACKGSKGERFVDNVVGSNWAHVFEHLLIDALVAQTGAVCAGNTKACAAPSGATAEPPAPAGGQTGQAESRWYLTRIRCLGGVSAALPIMVEQVIGEIKRIAMW
jgi:hypothetical protein